MLGIELKQLNNGSYELKSAKFHRITRNEELVIIWLQRLGIDTNTVSEAFDSMDQHGHNIVSFGHYGSFIYSKYNGTVS